MRTHFRLSAFPKFLMVAACLLAASYATAQPITSDSRIKTFVYNPNEVFSITTHYGYQSNIEFGPKESIETISVGDRVGWQVIPAGRRLFIRSMEENARTNMTVVTNQRAYQFELRSSSASAVFGSEALTYVVRFFYPAEGATGAIAPMPMPVANTAPAAAPAPVIARDLPPAPAPVPVPPKPVAAQAAPAPITLVPPPPAPAPAPVALAPRPDAAPAAGINYRYTLSGPDDIAPTRIYDDGKTTYFKLPIAAALPKFSILTAAGAAIDVPVRRTREGLVAVDVVAQQFRLKPVGQTGKEVTVYNEAGGEVN